MIPTDRGQWETVLASRYRLKGLLGRGGMGEVFLAEDLVLGREVALKVIRGDRATETRSLRFKREGEVAAAMDHPHIVKLHAFGSTELGDYLTYALVPGARELRDALPDLALEDRVRLIRDAARALGYAHGRGVVHRDVKAENLLVDAGGNVRLTDFGLAFSPEAERLTLSGVIVGTPNNLAPEQVVAHRKSIGPPTDVWALGVVLYEALCDEHPFPGNSLAELSAKIIRGRVERPDRVNPAVDADVASVCMRCLRIDPQRRYPNGDALADDLDACLAGEAPTARSSQHWAVGVGLLLTLVVGAVLALSLEGRKPSPTAERTVAVETERPQALEAHELREGSRRARRLRRIEDPVERRAEALAWLGTFSGHPEVEQVEELVRHARRQLPEARIVQAGRPPQVRLRGVFAGDSRIFVWCKGERTHHAGPQLWALDEDAPRVARSWGEVLQNAWVQGAVPVPGTSLLALLGNGGEFQLLPLDGPPRPSSVLGTGETADMDAARFGGITRVVVGGDRLVIYGLGEEGVERLHEVDTSGSRVQALAFSGSGRHVAASLRSPSPKSNLQERVSVFDVVSGALIHEHPGISLAFSVSSCGPDAFLFGTDLGQLTLLRPVAGAWRATSFEGRPVSWRPRVTSRQTAHVGQIRDVAASPDGAVLYSGGVGDEPREYALKAWDSETAELLWQVTLPALPLFMRVSPDGRRLAIGLDTNELLIWPTQ